MPEHRDNRSEAPRRSGRGLSLLGVVAGVTGAAAAVVAAGAAASAHVAREVVTPPRRHSEDVSVQAVWSDAQGLLVTLKSTRDSRLAGVPGEYSFWFDESRGHAVIGEIVDQTWDSITRRVLRVDFGVLDGRVRRGRVNGWVWLTPKSAGFDAQNVLIDGPLGPNPAWLVAAAPSGRPTYAIDRPDATDAGAPEHSAEAIEASREAPGAPADRSQTWVIHVHGRASARPEVIRGLGAVQRLGLTSLVVTYRNDGEATPSADNRYALGETEWEDVEAAIDYAIAHGAKKVFLFGWSMGGAIVLQALARTRHARRIGGVLLESPVVDWGDALAYQADASSVPAPVREFALTLLGRRWATPATGLESPIDLDALNWVARAGELRKPVLLMHSDDDGFVPSGPSRELAAARPDLVTFVPFKTARHCKLWNHDRELWESSVSDWLTERLATTATSRTQRR
ncbi:alpha/beta hydrolase family protein [Pseudoclavibacter sp. 13-3]|uniref:alpha/beta hydrolase family protein n=1 Tax=Pseudoclavibacter sp. 13-3 TaxID=2901228 RepID=UPI001E60F583|nr:alpha/beta hydrolase [Pseudoclavibacter sp. 13-3]MCD7100484.1 alpha/beta fold hydrolase [Pseudoclavibacter sp. 13-3]